GVLGQWRQHSQQAPRRLKDTHGGHFHPLPTGAPRGGGLSVPTAPPLNARCGVPVILDFYAPPPPWAPAHAGTRGIPSDGRCRAGPLICLGRAGDACVVGALERAGDTLYGARVYGKLGRRLAHAHAARQSCSDSLSQLVRDRRPAKSFTFTLG